MKVGFSLRVFRYAKNSEGVYQMAGQVLIADNDKAHRAALLDTLLAAHHDVRVLEDGEDLQTVLTESAPDALVIDAQLASPSLIHWLQKRRSGATTALIAIAASHEQRLTALRLGADVALTRPLGGAMLLARIRSLVRAAHLLGRLRQNRIAASDYGCAEDAAGWQGVSQIALVIEDPADVGHWTERLRGLSVRAMSPDSVLTVGQQGKPVPDAIITVINPTAGAPGGLHLLAELRSRAATRRTPILAVVARSRTDLAAMALDLGAADAIALESAPAEYGLKVRRMLRRKAELDALRAPVEESLRLAAIDPLTGVFNRRYAENVMQNMCRLAKSEGRETNVAVMIADLDHFKSVNDRYGHPAGDAVLTKVAARLRDGLRPDDLLARFGGEEFLIVMRDISAPAAQHVAQRLCARIRTLRAPVVAAGGGPASQPITISLGIAVGQTTGEFSSLEKLRFDADAALFVAKSEGRDCSHMVTSTRADMQSNHGLVAGPGAGQNAA